MTLNLDPENPVLRIGKQKTGTEGQAGSPNPTKQNEWNRKHYLKNCLVINEKKRNKRKKELDLRVKDLLKVNPKVMRKQIYKASELKMILK